MRAGWLPGVRFEVLHCQVCPRGLQIRPSVAEDVVVRSTVDHVTWGGGGHRDRTTKAKGERSIQADNSQSPVTEFKSSSSIELCPNVQYNGDILNGYSFAVWNSIL